MEHHKKTHLPTSLGFRLRWFSPQIYLCGGNYAACLSRTRLYVSMFRIAVEILENYCKSGVVGTNNVIYIREAWL